MTLDSSNLTRQRLVYAAAGKVLVYHSEPFEKDTEVSGIFKLSVWLAVDQPDTEFEAAVYEIGSNGSSILRRNKIQTARLLAFIQQMPLPTVRKKCYVIGGAVIESEGQLVGRTTRR